MIIFEQSDYLLTCKNFKHLSKIKVTNNQPVKSAASENKILSNSSIPISFATTVGINISKLLSPEWSIKLEMTSYHPFKENLLQIFVQLSIHSKINTLQIQKNGYSKNTHLLLQILKNALLKTATTYSQYRSANGELMLMKNVLNAMPYSCNQPHSISKD